ncbi:hypothetical protein CH63R_09887 [Colletotrichum higginsianum IMI 349063]|uniref:Uncharacterized protein n=1 Tax=Colletotrichum higginsianum (strain IMI 349063) TaxID=759273 RepID=A0A1B7Y197_COLHI|nr:uncharacterized protein CH63R_09887 [Colletotrichum higginsianum IMI 349063]OBR05767.1 hypothetical protein CH63R_09887 [Colletotrichum higginsianum IMI 349063]
MAENLKRCKLFPDIPPELWYLVAGHLVRQCAVVTLQGQFPADAKASTSEIDLSEPIYASYVKVDGNIYVRSLYNSPVGTSSSDTRLFFPTKEESKTAGVEVWVSEDHQGIRRVVFLAPGALQIWCNEQRPVPGFGGARFRWQTCVLPSRFKPMNLSSDPLSQLLWETPPASPLDLAPIVTLGISSVPPPRSRMKSFDCNHPDAIGYLVACCGDRIFDIVTHKREEKDISRLYENAPDWATHWMYMPLDEGEFITHIASQLRHYFNLRWLEIGLSFTTNKGRVTVFGWHAKTTDRILTVPRDKIRVYFNSWDHPDGQAGVQHLALERSYDNNDDAPITLKLPTAVGKVPTQTSPGTLIRTACSLDGISEIQPCIRQAAISRVIGIKVNYINGHRECLGQFRLDLAAEPISTCGSDTLFVRYARLTPNSFGITAIALKDTGEIGGVGWKAIPLSGLLEWRFCAETVVLTRNGALVMKPSEMCIQIA